MSLYLLFGLFLLSVNAQEYYCTNGTLVRYRNGPCGSILGLWADEGVLLVNLGELTTSCDISWRKVNTTVGVVWTADFLMQPCTPPVANTTLDPLAMVTGQFDPSRYPQLFGTVGLYGIPGTANLYLRHETLNALKLMYQAFTQENPTLHFEVVSALRNFGAQKDIWENKWKNVYNYILDPLDRGYGILTYSSMPGTSRHHWGTDFDLTNLNADYWTQGDGLKFYNWLVANASKWGFYQPYIAGRATGYSEERWHWSYSPIAVTLVKQWIDNRNNIISNLTDAFLGYNTTFRSLAFNYVVNINPKLLPTGSADPNDYSSSFYSAKNATRLVQGPCGNVTGLSSIPINGTFRSLSCCKTACGVVYRFGTFGQQSGYVDDSLFSLIALNSTSNSTSSTTATSNKTSVTNTDKTTKNEPTTDGTNSDSKDPPKTTKPNAIEESSANVLLVSVVSILVSIVL